MTPRGRCVEAELEPGSPLLCYPRFSGSLAPAASLGTSPTGLIEPSLHTNHLGEKKTFFFFFFFFPLSFKKESMELGLKWQYVSMAGRMWVCVCVVHSCTTHVTRVQINVMFLEKI